MALCHCRSPVLALLWLQVGSHRRDSCEFSLVPRCTDRSRSASSRGVGSAQRRGRRAPAGQPHAGMPRMSACSCMAKDRWPSLRRRPSAPYRATPLSCSIAATTYLKLVADGFQGGAGHVSRVWKRESPTIAPRASGRQYGANRPEKAGTKERAAGVGDASVPAPRLSAAWPRIPSWSRSHWIAEPVTAMEPSRAYTGAWVAHLVGNRGDGASSRPRPVAGPVFSRRKFPVP